MSEPLLTGYVGLLYEAAVTESYAGTNFGTHIAILPKYDVDDGSREAEFAPHNIAHEVAHYYWSGNADWIDEGGSDFMASAIENRRIGEPVGVTNDPCAYVRNIAELESLAPRPIADFDVFNCNYSLGERLFLDMHRALGDEPFWQGLRDLYRRSQVDDPDDGWRNTSMNIAHVREAFQSNPDAVSTVVSRWYDGTESYDLSGLDSDPVWPYFGAINGQIDEAYITIDQNGPEVTSFSKDDVNDRVLLNLEYSYSVTGGSHGVPLEIVEFYEDGFEFHRRAHKITAEDQYIGGTSWFWIGFKPWAPGRCWVYIYEDDRKLAEVQYEVTP